MDAEGKVYTFGFNGSGQLGHGNLINLYSPKAIETIKAVDVFPSNGCEHLIFMNHKQEFCCCGYNNFGQLSKANQESLLSPEYINCIKNAGVSASCSYYHSIFIVSSEDGPIALSVGRNDSGQLGLGNEISLYEAKIIKSLYKKKVCTTSCGLHHSLFLMQDGTVFSCGFNDNGQLGLKDNKPRYCYSHRNTPTKITDIELKFIKGVSCGYYHSMLVTDQGEVYAFGRNDKGQLGLVISLNRKSIQMHCVLRLNLESFYHMIFKTLSISQSL